jgi:hypothetical protein
VHQEDRQAGEEDGGPQHRDGAPGAGGRPEVLRGDRVDDRQVPGLW